jgi:hypothetical protein
VRRVFKVAAAEAAESDLLDEVRVMDSRAQELTAALDLTARESDGLRTATSSAIVELNRLARPAAASYCNVSTLNNNTIRRTRHKRPRARGTTSIICSSL